MGGGPSVPSRSEGQVQGGGGGGRDPPGYSRANQGQEDIGICLMGCRALSSDFQSPIKGQLTQTGFLGAPFFD